MASAVVAIGGNAILPAGSRGEAEDQRGRLEETSRSLVDMVQAGHRITITHGNGPQVGNLLLQNEGMRSYIPAMPLDVLVAETQAEIGYMIQQALGNEMSHRGLAGTVSCIVTQVVVDARDEAFQKPTKPIGPYYSEGDAQALMREKGWRMVKDPKGNGWRRLVPSPRPLAIVEREVIRRIVHNGTGMDVVIAAGGGGVPVVAHQGGFRGVEAVVDKDLASSVLARDIEADLLVIVTDVPMVALDFGKPTQRFLHGMTVAEAEGYMAQGQFPPGSMGPKVEAAVRFLRKGGARAIITDLPSLGEAVQGRAGTQVRP